MTTYIPPFSKEEEDEDSIFSYPLYIGKKSYFAYTGMIFWGIALIVCGFFLGEFSLVGSAITITTGLLVLLYAVVSKNFYEKVEIVPQTKLTLYRGILNKKTREISLIRAEKNEEQNFFQRITNTGDVILNVQGGEPEIFLIGYADFKNLSKVI